MEINKKYKVPCIFNEIRKKSAIPEKIKKTGKKL
jgi:hypothetical protein